MKCANHSDIEALVICNHCGKNICQECRVEIQGENYCKECVNIKVSAPSLSHHSCVLASILSFFIPGLGQFYNGQPGKGLIIFLTGWLILPWIFGIIDAFITAKRISQEKKAFKKRTGCLIAFVVGVVVSFVMFFVLLLLAAIAIPNFLRAKMNANEVAVKSTLNAISRAIEEYKAANDGKYPESESDLASYLSGAYNNRTIYGYNFSESFQPQGYKLTAVPEKCLVTGTKVFTIQTDGVLNSGNCEKY
jgi:TM2 domain-containing membrane protein YozV/type II secretory pathway pseudopilin PulG